MTVDTFKKQVLTEAQSYIAKGWKVFPLHTVDESGQCTCGNAACADTAKHPATRRGLKEASNDPAKVMEWFGPDAPPRNIGVVTGSASGITVLDIDIGPGKFGMESWREVNRDHMEPETLDATTGSGGMHAVFRYNSALNTASNVLGKGIDCRNDGGYIVAPPSRHRSGGVYRWNNWGCELADLPKHLSKRKETRGRKKKDDMYRSKYTIEQVEKMLSHIPPDDRDLWRNVGVILGREFDCADQAWDVYNEWSNQWAGKKGRNHEAIMHQAFYEISQEASRNNELSLGTIVKAALDNGWAPKTGATPIEQFAFHGPGNNFIYRPTSSYWVAGAVDAAVGSVNENGKLIPASEWLKANRLVTSMAVTPELPTGRTAGIECVQGELVEAQGAAVFNSYRRATIQLGDAKLAGPFVEHCFKVFNKPGDADQFLNYMAHRVQFPAEKPRFALLLAGPQGVGKDTAVEFCAPAIGPWNIANIDPAALDSNFNEFAAATLVRISEAANLHEMSKWALNEQLKVLIAGNPDAVAVNPKYGQKYYIRSHNGTVVTTNHLANAIYIPPDDRRFDVIESATLEEMGLIEPHVRRAYFENLWGWFHNEGGAAHVAAYLHERDLSGFSAANGQRRTSAHQAVVQSGMQSDHWLIDILDELGNPNAVRADWILDRGEAQGEKRNDIKRKLANAIGRLDYVVHRNQRTTDGRWKIGGKNVTVYVQKGTPPDYDPTRDFNSEIF